MYFLIKKRRPQASPYGLFSSIRERFTSFRKMIFSFSKGGKKMLNPFVQRWFRSIYE